MVRFATQTGWLLARHSIATLVTGGVACVLWTVTYCLLLLWAALFDGGLGGPLAYPGGLLLVMILSALVCGALLGPATAVAEGIARRYRLPVLAGIPLSVGVLFLLCAVAVAVAALAGLLTTVSSSLTAVGVLFLALLLPLGVYWWAAEGVPVLVAGGRRVVAWVAMISHRRTP